MVAKRKKISVDEKTYAEVLAYQAKRSAMESEQIDIGDAAILLIESGLRHESAGMWDSAYAKALRNVMREVAESDRLDRETQLRDAISQLEGQALCSRAALFAVLMVQGYSDEEIEHLYRDALGLAMRI